MELKAYVVLDEEGRVYCGSKNNFSNFNQKNWRTAKIYRTEGLANTSVPMYYTNHNSMYRQCKCRVVPIKIIMED